MLKIKMAGILAEVNDYSPFVKCILRIKIDEMAEYLTGLYGSLIRPNVDSSVGKDSLRFSIRKDLNDVFGLDYHEPDLAKDFRHHVGMWTEFEFGKGKKNEERTHLRYAPISTFRLCPPDILQRRIRIMCCTRKSARAVS